MPPHPHQPPPTPTAAAAAHGVVLRIMCGVAHLWPMCAYHVHRLLIACVEARIGFHRRLAQLKSIESEVISYMSSQDRSNTRSANEGKCMGPRAQWRGHGS
eukprot:scaffold13842_cov115-Isochrysis_galbana.AAC.4